MADIFLLKASNTEIILGSINRDNIYINTNLCPYAA